MIGSRSLMTIPLSILLGSFLVEAQEAPTRTPAARKPSAVAHNPIPAIAKAPFDPFLVKPYLQFGHEPATGKIDLVWHTADVDNRWRVDIRLSHDGPWQPAIVTPSARRIGVPAVEPHRVYHIGLTGLDPGKVFSYRIRKDDRVVFEAEALAPRVADQRQRFVVFGDCGANTPEQKAIAYRTIL